MHTKSSRLPIYAFLVFVVVVIAYLALRPDSRPAAPAGQANGSSKNTVAATVFPLYDIVRNVGKDVVTVQLILPANAEPHTYEPTPDAMKAIAASKAVYAIGHGLDAWVQPLADASSVPTVTVDAGLALRPFNGGTDGPTEGYDPHYWLNAANAKTIAATVAHDLTARFPGRADAIAANLAAYSAELDRADAEVRRLLASVTDRRLATFHGAFSYFAAAYGLEISATFEPFPGQEPTPRYLADLGTKVKQLKLKSIYLEPAFSSAAVQTFAAENGLQLGELDDLGGAPGRLSLAATLIYDAQNIADHQR